VAVLGYLLSRSMGVPVLKIRFVIGLFVQLGLFGLVIAPALGQEPNDDRVEVDIAARAGLRYDVVRFAAKPGQAIRLKLINGDDMAHNLVFTKPGQRQAVATAALVLGVDGEAKNCSSPCRWNRGFIRTSAPTPGTAS
jgi:hypothetical protein